jgi:uncharacterized protein YqhQ
MSNLNQVSASIDASSMPKFDFAVGGQAVIEGVMMRSKNYIAIAVRKKDNSIKIKDFPFQSIIQKHKWLNIPLLRGLIGMVEMMIVGFKALNFSSDEFEIEGEEARSESKKTNKFLDFIFIIGNLALSFGFAILLFKFVPLYLTEITNKYFSQVSDNYILYNLIDGFLKLLIFTIYIVLISLSKTIHRVFEYHGAEHKAVFNYEENSSLTVENSQKQSRFHPRCGTSFVVFVFLISVILYTFLPRDPDFILHFLKRVIWLPVVVGISYEVLKFSAKHTNSWWVKVFTAPGIAFQGLTTKEPSDDQVKVALAALKRTLELESMKSKDGTDTQI